MNKNQPSRGTNSTKEQRKSDSLRRTLESDGRLHRLQSPQKHQLLVDSHPIRPKARQKYSINNWKTD